MIIQTIPAPQMIQQPMIQPLPAPLPPPAPPSFPSGELKIVIGEAKPASTKQSSGSVIVYDMGRSNGGGVSLGGGGGGRSEYVLTSVDDFGGTYRGASGAFNDGFERDHDGGSFLSEGHRSAVIDIGKGGGNFYPSLPHYDD